jgi:hypothetical protein
VGVLDTQMKTVTLTEAEWKCLDMFLEELGDHQSNAGCNDLPKSMQALFTKKEGEELALEFAHDNNPKVPEGPDWPLPDFCLLSLLQHKIKKQTS